MAAVGVKAGAGGGPGGQGAAGAKGGSQRGKGGKNKKKNHKCGDSGSYGKMKDNFKSPGMERDHIPSGAALVERGGNLLKTPLCADQARAVKRAAAACAIPKGVHR